MGVGDRVAAEAAALVWFMQKKCVSEKMETFLS